jgi:RNA polymerase sigma factor (sigma-70 family)
LKIILISFPTILIKNHSLFRMWITKSNSPSKVEKELVEGCIQNDGKMQKALYDQYKNEMYSTAFRIIGDTDIAHDALQEAFINVFESLESFRFQSTLGAWIKTIVVRKAISKLKSVRQFDSLDVADKIETPETNFEFTAEELDNAIQSLPESAKAIFLLIEVEGYKHKEVAEMLGITKGTSKSQLNYSKKLLQKRLYEQI